MSDEDNFMIPTAGLENFEFAPPGPADGDYKALIIRATPEIAKTSKNMMIKAVAKVLDEDANPNDAIVFGNTVVSGKDKYGRDHMRYIAEFLRSIGRPQSDFPRLTAIVREKGLKVLLSEVVEPERTIAYVRIRRETYLDRTRAKIAGWITAEAYEKAKKDGTHRVVHKK